MGVTIAYRGRFADLARIEDFEDRLVDCALEIGGQVQIWRSWADDNPERMVRGVILGLALGQESTSLLLSPEGWLIGLIDTDLTRWSWNSGRAASAPLHLQDEVRAWSRGVARSCRRPVHRRLRARTPRLSARWACRFAA